MPLIFLLPFLGITGAYVYKTVGDTTRQTVESVTSPSISTYVYIAAGLGVWMTYKALTR